MAKFKTLKIKDKKYIFKSYGNDKAENPAYAVFARFPQEDEAFFTGSRKNIFEGADAAKLNTDEGKKEFVDRFLNNYLENVRAGRVDYGEFLRECVSEFGDFEYENKKIRTVDDFLKLPEAAVRRLSSELYAYARKADEFTMGE